MIISLTPDQEQWLAAEVKRGGYPSVEAAVQHMIDAQRLLRLHEEDEDLAWAKPLVDEARASVERGAVLSFDDFKAQVAGG